MTDIGLECSVLKGLFGMIFRVSASHFVGNNTINQVSTFPLYYCEAVERFSQQASTKKFTCNFYL